MHDLLRYHAELLYHPSPGIVWAYFESVSSNGNFSDVKTYFQEVIRGRYLIQQDPRIHNQVIQMASEAGDRETTIEAYLDVLDYKTLSDNSLVAVAEAMRYD